jgi:hypothetical protein
MYPQKVKSNQIFLTGFFVGVLKVTDKEAGTESGSVSQRYGSADPDTSQFVTDPEHWRKYKLLDHSTKDKNQRASCCTNS